MAGATATTEASADGHGAHGLRQRLEQAIADAINTLDALDGDADLEPSLGVPERHPNPYGYGERRDASGDQSAAWRDAGSGNDGEDDAGENAEEVNEDGDGDPDREPLLGVPECHPCRRGVLHCDQSLAWRDTGANDGREEENEHDVIEDHPPLRPMSPADRAAARAEGRRLLAKVPLRPAPGGICNVRPLTPIERRRLGL